MNRLAWITACMTLLSSAVSTGYSVAALMQHGTADVYVVYTLARSVALLLATLFALSTRRRDAILAIALAMSIVQLIDAYAGILQHDIAKTYGPLAFGLINIVLFLALVFASDVPHNPSRTGAPHS